MRGTSTTELEEAGEETDGAVTSKSKLRSKVKSLSGVDILTETGDYKSTYDILLEISKVWKDMSDINQAALLEVIAGKTRSNTAAAILSNTTDLEEAYVSALEAEGSALQENEKYLDSIQGRIDLFNNSVQTMWKNTLDDDVVKWIVNLGTQLIKLIDNIGLLKTLFIGLGTYGIAKYFKGDPFTALFGEKQFGNITDVTDKLNTLKQSYEDAQKAFDAADTTDKKRVAKKARNKARHEYETYERDTADYRARYQEELDHLDKLKAKRTELSQQLTDATEERDYLWSQEDEEAFQGAQQQVDNLTTQIKQTDQEIESANVSLQQFNTTQNVTGSLGTRVWTRVKAGIKSVGKELLAMAKSIAIMHMISTMFELIGDIGKGIGDLISSVDTSAEALQDKFEELNNELSGCESELKSLESELDTTQEQIDELLSSGKLSFTDQEELERLRAQSAELERQIKLKEALQGSLQRGANAASINATNAYLDTSFDSEKTKTTRQEEASETGNKWGKYIGMAIGAIVGGAITYFTGGTGAAVWGKAIAIGGGLGSMIGEPIGGGLGSLWAGAKYDSEETVGEAIANMAETRAELEKTRDKAYTAYLKTPDDEDIAANYEEAEEALSKYDETMAKHISQIQANYNAMDWSTATKPQKEAMKEQADLLDKYNIAMGGVDAKSNAIERIFGVEADDKLKTIKNRIEDVVTSDNWDGVLNLEDYFNSETLDAFNLRLREMGIYIYEVEDYFKDMAKAEQEVVDVQLYDVAVDINKITEGLESLKSAFDEVIENGSVAANTLVSLNDEFGTLGDAWDNYANTMFSGVASTKEMTEATEELAKAYIDSKIISGELTSEEKWTYIIQLQNIGVENAQEYVEDKLNENKLNEVEVDVKASLAYDKNDLANEFATLSNDEKKALGLDGKIFSDFTDEEFEKLAEYFGITKELNADAKQEIIDRYGSEIDNIDAVISKLEEKANKEQEIANLNKKIESYQSWYSSYKSTEQDYNDERYKDLLKQYNISDFNPSLWYYDHTQDVYFNGEYHIPASVFNELQELYNLQEKLVALKKEGEEKGYIVDGKVVNPDFEKELDGLQEELDAIKEEISTELTADVELKIKFQDKSDLVDKLQETYDTLAEAEKEYNENKGYVSVDTLQSLLQLEPKYLALLYDEQGQLNLNKESILNVAKARTLDMGIQAAQNVIEQASNALEQNKIDTLRELTQVTYGQAEASWALVEANLAVLKSTIERRNADATDEMYGKLGGVYEGIESQVLAIQDLTNRSVENIDNAFSTNNTAKGAAEDATEKALEEFQKAIDYWENQISANQAKYEQIQNEIDLLEKQGKIAGEEYYQEQIKLENERLSLLEQQRDEAERFLGTFEEGSDEWWEVAGVLNDIEGEIDDVTSSLQDLSDAMAQIEWDVLDEVNERYDNLIGKLETIRDLIAPDGEEDWFDDNGEWTEDGVAVLGTYIQQLEMYKNALTEANEQLEKFNRPYAGNESYYKEMGIDSEQEWYDKRKEWEDYQQTYLQGISDSEQAVVGMYESQIDALEEYTNELIDSYNEYIDLVKEAIDAERDLYEFKKDITKQTKDIASLERRIASLSGSTNAADIAERRKLEADLFEAKENLNDSYYTHAKDQQSQALDEESEAYSKSMEDYIETLRTTLDDATTDMVTFINIVTDSVMFNAATIKKEYVDTGVALDDAIVSPWDAAIDQIKKFEGADGLAKMNSWTTEKGFFGQFKTKATGQLKSPWTAGTNAVNAFKTDVKAAMENVVSNVRTNVVKAKNELNELYKKIQDTNKKAQEVTGGDDNNYDGSGNKKWHANATITTQFGTYGGNGNGSTQEIAKEKAKEKALNTVYRIYKKNGYKDEQLEKFRKSWDRTVQYSGVSYYAKGTTGTTRDELAITDEIGDELVLIPGKNGNLQYMRKGTAVMPADISANLIEWGKLNPNMMSLSDVTSGINLMSNYVNKPEINLDIEHFLHVDNVSQDTLPTLKKFVTQEMNNLIRQLNYGLKKVGAT